MLVFTMHDDDFHVFTQHTLPNKEEYCERHGYELRFGDFSEPVPEPNIDKTISSHRKLCQIKQQLVQCLGEYDWLCWIDGDAIIMNYKIQLESFVDDTHDLIIGEDWNGLNAGVFFLRVCQESIDFMTNCIEYKPTEDDRKDTPEWWWPSEQCAYTKLLPTIKSKIVNHSEFNGYVLKPIYNGYYSNDKFIPQIAHNDWRHMNIGSYTFEYRPFQIGDFILHITSGSIEYKLPYLYKYLGRIVK